MNEDAGRTLGPKGAAWLESRKLDPEVAVRLGVFTGRNRRNAETGESEVIPSDAGNVLVFPVQNLEGKEVRQKYRGPDKRFWQSVGGERHFWGAEILSSPELTRPVDPFPLVITEGEPDRIAAVQCDFPYTVSVPDGAPPPPKPGEPVAKDANEDAEGKFQFVWLARAALAKIRRFIIAVDSDAPGKALEAELVRRLGPARCSFVTYPEPAAGFDACKDLNDVLMQYGADEVRRVLNEAKPYPVHGLFRLADYPDRPRIRVFASGIVTLDRHFQIFEGANVILTGIPSHGKSTLLGNWLVNLSERYGWRHTIITPEMPIVTPMRDKLRRQYLRSAIYAGDGLAHGITPAHLARADEFINEHFSFIEPDPTVNEEDELSVEWVLAKADDALQRFGIKTLSIDPWNELEHAIAKGETETRYIGRSIRKIKRWGMAHGVATIIAAHPTKEVARDGKIRRPRLYDVDGGAHWNNKPDAGIVVHREDKAIPVSTVAVDKVRFDETGKEGVFLLDFDKPSQRYSDQSGDGLPI